MASINFARKMQLIDSKEQFKGTKIFGGLKPFFKKGGGEK